MKPRTAADNAQWWLDQAARYEATAARCQSADLKAKWQQKAANARATAIAYASCVE